ncbi:hypothetical protein A1O7_07163 [Cladophialophora yegresii CBS 114405]|uniref:Prion-inhibition and propagation HeLo domain-containing protein n=1 Tax=Cladophialophora yegresii CBS 114405 TaxID=1182544 RepID=W9WE59_9EURO|nr:uncharacterized protein A1O7_07163 [Cladophialophora yegresii CBS 114405]EXJ56819.1 hypothetical protein A1O7_07163 [Cladophialophora yegresii CBS 114405]
MAEPIGLALGTVALASLFTTCIDFMEYFELSKDYKSTYNTACLKLSLLQSRLDTWGRTLGLHDDYRTRHERSEPCLNWPCQGNVIESSLQGIADIFGNADILKDKYRLVPRRTTKVNHDGSKSDQASAANPKKGRRHLFAVGTRRISFSRRSTTWAIRDKQRFDILIDDLDFLISNLEAVSFGQPTPSTQVMNRNNNSNTIGSAADTTPRVSSQSPDIVANQSAHRAPPSMSQQWQPQEPGNGAGSSPSVQHGAAEGTAQPSLSRGYHFKIDSVTDNVQAHQGTVGQATLTALPEGHTFSGTIVKASGYARVTQGAISEIAYGTTSHDRT